MDADGVVSLLKEKVAQAGSICALSRETGVHSAVISLTVRGLMKPPPCLLTAIGLKKTVTYEPI